MSAITTRIVGKKVKAVLRNNRMLQIVCEDERGAVHELTIAWLDDNGKPVEGVPCIVQSGARIIVRSARDAEYFPRVRTHGEA